MRKFLYRVAVPVSAGLVLLFVQYCVIQSEEKIIPVEGSAVKIRPSNEDSPSTQPEEQIRNDKSRTDSESIRESLPLALQINRSIERNSALGNLVDSALKIPDLSLAVAIAKSIDMSTDRNAVYARIIDKALSMREYKTADFVALRIDLSTPRNEQIKKILKTRTDALRK